MNDLIGLIMTLVQSDILLVVACMLFCLGLVFLLAAIGVKRSASRTYTYDSSPYDKYTI